MKRHPSKPPTVLCVAPFNNPHIVPFYDEVSRISGLDVTCVSLDPVTPERLKLGWHEMDKNSGYLQPWRSFRDRIQYYKRLVTSDLVLFPGFFHTRTLPLHHTLRRLTFRPVLLWSEPFLNHPLVKNESPWKRVARRIVLKPFNSSSYHLLAMGHGAEEDYRSLGLNRWEYRQFLFSVRPHKQNDATLPASKEVRKLIYCGALSQRKGVDLLIEAVAGIENIPFSLSILGDGPLRQELTQKVEKLGLSEQIEFLGSTDIKKAYEHMISHDLLVLPSRFDGWGAVVNEAMECSLAVISSDQVGSRRPLIEPGINGYVFKSESVEDLRATIVTAIGDRKALDQMKAASRDRIDKFSPSATAKAFGAFCKHLTLGDEFQPSSETLRPI